MFTVINTIYGEGDGSTTFNIPDLRDVWLVGSGIEHNVGESVAEGLPNITGMVRFASPPNTGTNTIRGANGCFLSAQFKDSGDNGELESVPAVPPVQRNSLSINASNSSAIYGASDHVTPNSIALLLCIIYE